MAVTTQVRVRDEFGERTVTDWRRADLLAPSAVKPVLTTIERRLVLKELGQLQPADRNALRAILGAILGAIVG